MAQDSNLAFPKLSNRTNLGFYWLRCLTELLSELFVHKGYYLTHIFALKQSRFILSKQEKALVLIEVFPSYPN